ncbi:hypothetical protein EHS25_008693 [Saitozyma podzolica]|uniref:Uncharacterized protein n=1 Tax=Saitozyma podzolica TaxID=1890683 RepID=A0A427YMC6_9TREE|nr:hypothetical protein EHS25_008693 [Saitozyma podzolica]
MSQNAETDTSGGLAPGTEGVGVTSTATVATQSSTGATEASVTTAASVFVPSADDVRPVQGMRLPLADEGNDTVSEYVLGHLGWVRRRWNLSSMDLRLYYWYGDDDTTIAAVQTAPNESREGDLLSDVKVETISTGRLHHYQPRENLAAVNPTGSERSVFGTVGQSDDYRRGSYLLVSRGGPCLLDGGMLHRTIESVYDKAFNASEDDDDYCGDDEDRWELSLSSAYDSYIGFLQGQGVTVTGGSVSRELEPCDVFHYQVHKLQQRKDIADEAAVHAERKQEQHQLESMFSGFEDLSF